MVYVLALIACVSILVIPWMGRQKLLPLVGMWSVIYLVARLLLSEFNPKWPIFGGYFTY
jgi:hypothetical protein